MRVGYLLKLQIIQCSFQFKAKKEFGRKLKGTKKLKFSLGLLKKFGPIFFGWSGPVRRPCLVDPKILREP
jgi:hypothetical protein